jgi:hypothetical protein
VAEALADALVEAAAELEEGEAATDVKRDDLSTMRLLYVLIKQSRGAS